MKKPVSRKPINSITSIGPCLIKLEDLAKQFNQSEDHFLIQGLLNSLDLLVYVPASAEVGLTNFSGHIGKVGDMRRPDYLKLGHPEISEIVKTSSAHIGISLMGYQLLEDGSIRSSTAQAGWDFTEKMQVDKTQSNGISNYSNSLITMTHWTIKDSSTSEPIKIHRSDIVVQRSDVLKLKNKLTKYINIDLRHCHSEKLEYLYTASALYWGDESLDYSERENHPATEKIIEWFMAQGFTETLAKAAVTIITPAEAKTRGPKAKTGFTHKIT